MNTTQEIPTETIKCKKCNNLIDILAVFLGGICLNCHEIKFNAQVKFNNGILPRPNFSNIFSQPK